MKADAVFEGGGVKGVALAGAIAALEEEGYQWNKVAGTSAGAIAAALIAAGYTGKELKDILINLDYKLLLNRKGRNYFAVEKMLKLVKNKGIYSGDIIEEWLRELLKKKGKEKFRDISINGSSTLKIIASDISRRTMLILPDDLIDYGIDPMDFDIAAAVRISMSIPFFFTPVTLNYKDGQSFMVDGGLLSNFPVWIFDVDGPPRWPTFGFRLFEGDKSSKLSEKKDLVSYSLDIINTLIDRKEEIYLDDKNRIRTMDIPTLGVKTTQFSISRDESTKLYESGYNTAKKFISTWDFQNYIKKYRL